MHGICSAQKSKSLGLQWSSKGPHPAGPSCSIQSWARRSRTFQLICSIAAWHRGRWGSSPLCITQRRCQPALQLAYEPMHRAVLFIPPTLSFGAFQVIFVTYCCSYYGRDRHRSAL